MGAVKGPARLTPFLGPDPVGAAGRTGQSCSRGDTVSGVFPSLTHAVIIWGAPGRGHAVASAQKCVYAVNDWHLTVQADDREEHVSSTPSCARVREGSPTATGRGQ